MTIWLMRGPVSWRVMLIGCSLAFSKDAKRPALFHGSPRNESAPVPRRNALGVNPAGGFASAARSPCRPVRAHFNWPTLVRKAWQAVLSLVFLFLKHFS